MWYATGKTEYSREDNHTGFKKLPPNANLWKRWCRVVRKLTTVSEQHFCSRLWYRSRYALRQEQRRHMYESHWCTIHPFSPLQKVWQIVMIGVWLVVMPMDLFTMVYHKRMRHSGYQMIKIYNILYWFQALSAINMLLSFFTGFPIKSKHHVELDIKKIALHYVLTYFVSDIYTINFFVFYYCPHNFRLRFHTIHVNIFFVAMRYLRLKSALQNVELIIVRFTSDDSIYKILRTFILMVFLVHIDACAYIGVVQDFMQCKDCWLQKALCKTYHGIYRDYHVPLDPISLYFQIAMLSFHTICGARLTAYIQAPFMVKDLIYRTPIQLIGIGFNIYMFILTFKILGNWYYHSIKFNGLIDSFRTFMTAIAMPPSAAKSGEDFFEFRLQKDYFKETSILDSFSNTLYVEVFIQSSMGLIERSVIFRHCSQSTILSLAKCLQYKIFMPGDKITEPGQLPTCMYFIMSGSVSVTAENGLELIHLHDGEHFGEMGMLGLSKSRKFKVIALEMCELYRLEKFDFDNIVFPNSQIYYNIVRSAKKRLNYLLRNRGYVYPIDNDIDDPNDSIMGNNIRSVHSRSSRSPRPSPSLLLDIRHSTEDDTYTPRSSTARPSTVNGTRPSTWGDERPSTSSDAGPSTSNNARPSSSNDARPSSSSDTMPSISRPSTSSNTRPSTSSDARPSTSNDTRLSISSDARPSTSNDGRPEDPSTDLKD